jgi:hypothetical protein
MTQIPPNDIPGFHASTLEQAIGTALNYLLAQPERDGEEEMFTLVFAGENATAEGAVREAIEDIRSLAVDHGGIPTGITIDAVVRTDIGTRIWGTMSCVPGTPGAGTDPASLSISIQQEGPTAWTLTLGRNGPTSRTRSSSISPRTPFGSAFPSSRSSPTPLWTQRSTWGQTVG